MLIREADPSEHDAMVRLSTERNPHESAAEAGWMYEVPKSWPDLVALVACSDDGEILGHARMATGTHMAPGRTAVALTVARDQEQRGVAGALWRALSTRRPAGATQLRAAVFDDEPRALEVALHWGFVVEERSLTSTMPLADVPLADVPVPDVPDGVTLDSRTDFAYPDREAVEAMLLASRTSPEARAGAVLDLARLQAVMTGSTPVQVVARVDGVPAAIVSGSIYDGQLSVMYTGVDPRFRGRGLALLVKRQAHHDAAGLGATTAFTTNEAGNAGILAVNAELGYVTRHGTYRLRLDL